MLSTEESSQIDRPVVEDENSTIDVVEATEPDRVDKDSSTIFIETSNATEIEAAVDEEESIDQAVSLLEQGKHLLSIKDYTSAVNILLSACCKFCKIYGDLANECGDVYFYYGCALFEFEKSLNSQAVNNRKKRNLVKDSNAGGDTIEADNCKKNGNENGTTLSNHSERCEFPSSGDCCEKIEKSTGEITHHKNEVGEQETMVPIDEISDSALASEILKISELIFLRQNNELKLIDVYSKLSDIDIFLENYTDAVIYSKKCLALHDKQPNLAKKKIALTLIQIGKACLLSKQYYEAVKHFTSAGVVLERAIKHLLKSPQLYDGGDSHNEEIETEVVEMRDMLQTIKDKICDVEDLIRKMMNSGSEANYAITSKETNFRENAIGSSISEIRANVISNFLKRKRKLWLNNGDLPKKQRL